MQEQAQEIINQTAFKYSVSPEWIVGATRSHFVMRARFEAMQRIRNELNLSYPKIGKIFNRDHTTIILACRKDIGIPKPPPRPKPEKKKRKSRAKILSNENNSECQSQSIVIPKSIASAKRIVTNGNGYVVLDGGQRLLSSSRRTLDTYWVTWNNGSAEFISDKAALMSLGLLDARQ